VHHVRLEAEVLQQPPPAERRLERRRGASGQPADHRQDRRHAIGHVPVGEHLATLTDHRRLGTLAVHVDPDVDIAGLLPELVCVTWET